MNNQKIIEANIKQYKKINLLHKNYYKDKRSLAQFFWLFKKEKNKIIKHYYISLKKNKITSTLGFIKYKLINKNILIDAYKPEDVLSNIDGVKDKAFERIHQKFEKKNYSCSILVISGGHLKN